MDLGQGRIVAIVGGGVAGLSAAGALGRLGFRVNVYQPVEADTEKSAGRAALLTRRALEALDRLGAGDEVRAQALPVQNQLLYHGSSGCAPERLRTTGVSISLEALCRALRNAALRHDNVEVFSGQACVEADAAAASIRCADDQGEGFVASSLLIGADGPHSVVRRALQLTSGFGFSQQFGPIVSKAVVCQSASAAAEPCRVFARGGLVITALASPEGWCTITVHGPARGPMGLEVVRSAPAGRRLLELCAPELALEFPELGANLGAAALERPMTAQCSAWGSVTPSGSAVALVGEAARGSPAILGLDVGAGIEDAAALGAAVEQAGGDLSTGILEYDRKRRPEGASADVAMSRVLSDLLARSESRLARARTGLERAVADMFPGVLTPRARLIAAGAEAASAARRAERLDRVLRALAVSGLILVLFVLVLMRVPAWPLLVAVVLGAWAWYEYARRDGGAQRAR